MRLSASRHLCGCCYHYHYWWALILANLLENFTKQPTSLIAVFANDIFHSFLVISYVFCSHFQEVWCARRHVWCSKGCTQTWQPFTSKLNFWCIYINFQRRAWLTTFFMSTAMYPLWLGVETISGMESIFILVFYFGRKCAQLVSVYIAPLSNDA